MYLPSPDGRRIVAASHRDTSRESLVSVFCPTLTAASRPTGTMGLEIVVGKASTASGVAAASNRPCALLLSEMPLPAGTAGPGADAVAVCGSILDEAGVKSLLEQPHFQAGALIRLRAVPSDVDASFLSYTTLVGPESACQSETWRRQGATSASSALPFAALSNVRWPPGTPLALPPTAEQPESAVPGSDVDLFGAATARVVGAALLSHAFSGDAAAGHSAALTLWTRGSIAKGHGVQFIAIPTASVTGSGVAFSWLNTPKVASIRPDSRQSARPQSARTTATTPRSTADRPSAVRPESTTAPGGLHGCPNCNGVIPRDEHASAAEGCRAVTFEAIARHALKRQREARHHMERLIPPTVPELPRRLPDGRTVLAPRPKSARHARDRQCVAALAGRSADAAPIFSTGHEWAQLPPVLQHLTVSVDEILARPTWKNRAVQLCGTCADIFAPVSATSPSANGNKALKRDAAEPDDNPPPCLQSEVIDSIVLTDLQAAHRRTRRFEREKFEMRRVVNECVHATTHMDQASRDAADVERLAEGFVCSDAAITTADAPLALSLCSELYRSMLRVVAIAPEPELGAVVSRPRHEPPLTDAFLETATELPTWVIPPPTVLVSDPEASAPGDGDRSGRSTPMHPAMAAADILRDPVEEAPASQSHHKCRSALSRLSFTYSQLRSAEQQLVVDTVGRDKQHVAALCLGTGDPQDAAGTQNSSAPR